MKKDALIEVLEKYMDEYTLWNEEQRTDGLIIHTDALDDFILWLKCGGIKGDEA
jgi:hypothetical protein